MSDTRKVPPSRHAIRFFSVPLRYRAFQPECGELMSVRAPGADSADEKASRKSFTHSKYSGVFSCAATRLGCSARPKSDDVLFGTSTRLLGRTDGYIWVPSTKAMSSVANNFQECRGNIVFHFHRSVQTPSWARRNGQVGRSGSFSDSQSNRVASTG